MKIFSENPGLKTISIISSIIGFFSISVLFNVFNVVSCQDVGCIIYPFIFMPISLAISFGIIAFYLISKNRDLFDYIFLSINLVIFGLLAYWCIVIANIFLLIK